MPLVIAFIVALAGLATWLKYKSHQAPVQRLSVGNEGAPSGGFFSLSHPTLPKAPIVRTGRGDFAAPDSIRLSFNPIDALSKFFGHDGPSIPTGGYDVQVSDAVQARVEELARAIAKAEGFGIPGALPTLAKNPGDMKLGDVGNGLLHEKTVFSTAQDGWDALYNQIKLIIGGRSSYYRVDNTFAEMARTWTGNNNAASWAATVTAELRVSQSSTLRSFLGL